MRRMGVTDQRHKTKTSETKKCHLDLNPGFCLSVTVNNTNVQKGPITASFND